MTASASVSTGSGADCSGTAAFSTAGAGASVGGATSGIFFLSSAICKPPFRGMKKASPQTGRVEVTSLRGFIYENAARCPVGRRCSHYRLPIKHICVAALIRLVLHLLLVRMRAVIQLRIIWHHSYIDAFLRCISVKKLRMHIDLLA